MIGEVHFLHVKALVLRCVLNVVHADVAAQASVSLHGRTLSPLVLVGVLVSKARVADFRHGAAHLHSDVQRLVGLTSQQEKHLRRSDSGQRQTQVEPGEAKFVLDLLEQQPSLALAGFFQFHRVVVEFELRQNVSQLHAQRMLAAVHRAHRFVVFGDSMYGTLATLPEVQPGAVLVHSLF